MDKSVAWKERGEWLLHKAQRSLSAASVARKRLRRALTISAYWGAVSVVGVLVAIVILRINDVPVIQPAYAGAGSWVGTLVGTLLYYTIIGPIGLGAIIVAYIMQLVINYPFGSIWTSAGGGFVNVSAVQTGWKLVRDVCNMFFSLILVIIALATVLKIEAYSWQKMLPKLILMAVLINFSKTICGVFTDFATVAMATFGGSFGSTFAGGVVGAFGLSTLNGLSQSDSTIADSSLTSVLLAYVAAAVMTMIFFVVMLSFTVTLLFRIVMLWFLIVLSPIAYIARILPQTQKYSKEWWEMFGRYVTVGPLVTFFLWLSLTMAFGTEVGSSTTASGNPIGVGFSSSAGSSALSSTGYTAPSGAFNSTSPNVLANFLIATMLLMASLQLIHKMASEAGKLTGAVEKGAWGAGAALMTMPGQLMQKFSGGVGKLERVNAQGETEQANWLDRGLYNWSHGRSGKVAAFLGSTVFQPTDWFEGVMKGRKEAYEDKKHVAQNKAEQVLHGMRGDAVSGENSNAFLGRLSRLAGVIGGAGLDPKQIADEYLSGSGVLRMAGAFARRHFDENAAELEAQQGRLTGELHDATQNRVTQEETEGAMNDLQQREGALNDVLNGQQHLENNDPNQELNQDFEEVQAAMQTHIGNLEQQIEAARRSGDDATVNRIQTNIDDLQHTMQAGGQITLEDMQQLYNGNSSDEEIRNLFSGAYGGRAQSLQNETNRLRNRLQNSGWNGTFGAGAAFTNLATAEGRTQLRQQLDDVRLRAQRLRSEAQVHREGDSYEARKHTQHLISEEAHKIDNIDNTQELAQYLERAVREKNQYMAEAILRQIAKKGDMNEWTQQYLADQGIGPEYRRQGGGTTADINEAERGADGQPIIELDATSDGDGLELARRRILVQKLGMTEHESLRLSNDLSYIAEGIGQMGYSRAYNMQNGHLHFQNRAARARAAGAEIRKRDTSDWVRWNRLAWGYEDRQRQFHLSDLGRQLLVANGNSLGQQRIWERLNANSKLNLSHPHVVQELRDSGVDAGLVTRLETYWEQTGQYETNDPALRRQRGAVSRFATFAPPPGGDHH